MIDERYDSLAAMYAVGALPAEERSGFEHAMHSNLELQVRVQEFRKASEMLPFVLPQLIPPPGTRSRILATIGAAPQVAVNRRDNWIKPAAIFAGAVLLVVALIGGIISVRLDRAKMANELRAAQRAIADLQHRQQNSAVSLTPAALQRTNTNALASAEIVQQNEQLLAQNAQLQQQIQQVAAEAQSEIGILTNRIAELSRSLSPVGYPAGVTYPSESRFATLKVGAMTPAPDAPPFAFASGASIWDTNEQRGLVVVQNLPPPGRAQDYQLWVYQPDSDTATSAGVLKLTESNSARVELKSETPLNAGGRFVITVEPKGGSQAPNGKIVMVGN